MATIVLLLTCLCIVTGKGRRVQLHNGRRQGSLYEEELRLQKADAAELEHDGSSPRKSQLHQVLLVQNPAAAAATGGDNGLGRSGVPGNANGLKQKSAEPGPGQKSAEPEDSSVDQKSAEPEDSSVEQRRRTRSWPWQQKDAEQGELMGLPDNTQSSGMLLQQLRRGLFRERYEIEEHFNGLLENKEAHLQSVLDELDEERKKKQAAIKEGIRNLEKAERSWESKQSKWSLDRELLEEEKYKSEAALKNVDILKAEKAQLELDLSNVIVQGLENSNLVDSLLAEKAKLESDLKMATYQVLKDSNLVNYHNSEKAQLESDLKDALEQVELDQAEKAQLQYKVSKDSEIPMLVDALKAEKEQLEKDMKRVLHDGLGRVLKDDIPQIFRKEPNVHIFAENLTVIDHTGAKVEGLPRVKLLLRLLRRVPKKFVVKTNIQVDTVNHGRGIHNMSFIAKWRVKLGRSRLSRVRFWHEVAPVEIVAETLFLVSSENKVDLVQIVKWLVNGKEFSLLPALMLSDRPATNIQKINEWVKPFRDDEAIPDERPSRSWKVLVAKVVSALGIAGSAVRTRLSVAGRDLAKKAKHFAKQREEKKAQKKTFREAKKKAAMEKQAQEKAAEEAAMKAAAEQEALKKAEEKAAREAERKAAEERRAQEKAAREAEKQAEEQRKAQEKAAEEAAKKAVEEEEARKRAEEMATKEAERKAAEERRVQEKAAREAEKNAAEEKKAQEKEAQEAAKKAAAEQEAQKQAEEKAAKEAESKAAEERRAQEKAAREAQKKAAEERKSQEKAADEAAKEAAAEQKAQMKAEENAAREAEKKAAEERRAQEKATREAEKQAEEEKKAQEKAAEEAAKKAAEEQEAQKRATEMAAKEAEKRATEEKKAQETATREAEKKAVEERRAQEKAAREAEIQAEEEKKAQAKAAREAEKEFAEQKRAQDKAAEEAAKMAAAEQAAQKTAEEKAAREAEKKAAEERRAQEKANKEAQKKAEEEKKVQQRAAEQAAKKAAEELEAQKQAEEKAAKEAERKATEERKAQEKATIEAEKKAAEEKRVQEKEAEEAAKRAAAEQEAQKKAEEKAAKEAEKQLAEEKKAQEKAAREAEKKAAEEKEAQERAAEAAAKKAMQEQEAQNKAEEKAAKEADKKAADDLKAQIKTAEEAAQKAAEELEAQKKAEKKVAAEAEKKATEERRAQEKAAKEAEKRAAEEKKAIEKAVEEAAKKAAEEEEARKKAEEKAAKEAEKQAEQERKAREKAAIEAEKKAAKEAAEAVAIYVPESISGIRVPDAELDHFVYIASVLLESIGGTHDLVGKAVKMRELLANGARSAGNCWGVIDTAADVISAIQERIEPLTPLLDPVEQPAEAMMLFTKETLDTSIDIMLDIMSLGELLEKIVSVLMGMQGVFYSLSDSCGDIVHKANRIVPDVAKSFAAALDLDVAFGGLPESFEGFQWLVDELNDIVYQLRPIVEAWNKASFIEAATFAASNFDAAKDALGRFMPAWETCQMHYATSRKLGHRGWKQAKEAWKMGNTVLQELCKSDQVRRRRFGLPRAEVPEPWGFGSRISDIRPSVDPRDGPLQLEDDESGESGSEDDESRG